jgi:hypothetical protein
VQNKFASLNLYIVALLKVNITYNAYYFMVYNYYYEAYDALVKENDGVLPDLYELANLTISCHPADLLSSMTVADVVALALVEMSTLVTPTSTVHHLPVATVTHNGLVDLDELLAHAVVSRN